MPTSGSGLSGGKARAAGERLPLHDHMKRVSIIKRRAPSAERRAPSVICASSVMRALRRAAAALPALSRRSRSQPRGRASEPTPSGSARPPRGGAASRSSFPAFAGLRSGSARALAGALVLLALGGLAAPLAEAQTSPPPLTGLKAIPLVVDSNRYDLEVRWDPWPGARKYTVKWNEGWGFPNFLGGISGTSVVIKRGATPGRTYTVEVTANGDGGAALARASTRVSLHRHPAGPLTVTPVEGDPAALDASWPAMTGVGSYTLRWKVAGEPDNTYVYARDLPSDTTTRRITGLIADSCALDGDSWNT